ncbi:hypothetical protein AMAG_17452 [Allomyces macrogynus ATCC 38327]|uniref:TmcB/TmcC TPR repeats domain-containing protein n=1 Tax=Allomyces macrogynus (strain ATCC 38327) TaxID=578462 RepID=A0A0L0TEW0_ALLM3|nr:hypothetical protein AMAG_17452 [Allomyces macrogynus ATCC 38327]|eukprot:KNE73282.1 hypothetical protein AMAG_17452 [Allomyces macrogynus ATCC 38327]
MLLVQRIQTLYFELAYALTAENHVIDLLEAFSTLLEFFQISAFIFSPQFTAWGAPDFQAGLKYALLSFDSTTLDSAFEVAIVAMFLAFMLLVAQIYRKGGISQFRVLQFARVLIGVLGTFLLMPIVENCIHATYAYLVHHEDTTHRDWTSVLVLDGIVLVGLLVPAFGMAYLQGPDYRKLTAFSHTSSRQQVILLAVKVIISVAYGVVPAALFPYILLVCLIAHMTVSFYMPPYFYLVSNLIWTGQQAALIYGALILAILTQSGATAPVSGDPHPLLYAAILGMIPAGMAGSALFYYRVRSLLAGLGVWTAAIRAQKPSLMINTGPATTTVDADDDDEDHMTGLPHFRDLAAAVPAADLLHRCRFPLDVMFAANTLFVTFGSARGLWPGTWIALSAVLGDHSVQQKGLIQSLIRKTLAKRITSLDTRFGFYSIIKNFEISVFRQQGEDTRRLDVLDIIRYHYNYTEAMKNYLAALKWSHQFWKVCSAERVAVDALGYIADKMQVHQSAALHHYHVLLERFPSSISILRSYAAFVMDCINNERLGDEILEFADRLEEDRAAGATVGLHHGHPSQEAPGRRTGSPTTDDSRSEHSSSYSQSKSSDLMSSINSQSIFDVAAFDERRNEVAMGTIRSLSRSIIVSLVVLISAGIILYPLGMMFFSSATASSDLLLNAGILRRFLHAGALSLRELQLLAKNSNSTTAAIAAQQADVLAYAKDVYSSIDQMFYRSNQTLDNSLVAYLTTATLTDVHFPSLTTTKLSPLALCEFFYLSLYSAALTPAANLASEPNMEWGVANSLSTAFFDFVQGIIAAYQSSYEAGVRMRAIALQTVAGLSTGVPLLIFLIVFTPKWLRLRRELAATTKLFARIPRNVASVLATDMKERIQAKLESEGMLEHGVRIDKAAMAGADVDGGNSSSGGAAGAAARESTAHRTLAMRVLGAYVGAFLLALVLIITYTLCLVQPIQLTFQRGSLVNYGGMRLSIILRLNYEARELARAAPGDPQRRVWANAITDHLELLTSVHTSVLYGNVTLGLPRTVGRLPAADAITFTPACASAQWSCLSVDETIVFFESRMRRVLLATADVNPHDLADLSTVVDPSSAFFSNLLALRGIYATMDQDVIDHYLIAAQVAFGLMFPIMGGVAYYLWRTDAFVQDRIRRTRNILFQLPDETVRTIPAIAEYLDRGTIDTVSIPSEMSFHIAALLGQHAPGSAAASRHASIASNARLSATVATSGALAPASPTNDRRVSFNLDPVMEAAVPPVPGARPRTTSGSSAASTARRTSVTDSIASAISGRRRRSLTESISSALGIRRRSHAAVAPPPSATVDTTEEEVIGVGSGSVSETPASNESVNAAMFRSPRTGMSDSWSASAVGDSELRLSRRASVVTREVASRFGAAVPTSMPDPDERPPSLPRRNDEEMGASGLENGGSAVLMNGRGAKDDGLR